MFIYTVCVRIWCVCLVCVCVCGWWTGYIQRASGLMEISSCLPVFRADVLLVEEGLGRHARHSAHSPSATS